MFLPRNYDVILCICNWLENKILLNLAATEEDKNKSADVIWRDLYDFFQEIVCNDQWTCV